MTKATDKGVSLFYLDFSQRRLMRAHDALDSLVVNLLAHRFCNLARTRRISSRLEHPEMMAFMLYTPPGVHVVSNGRHYRI